MVSLRIRGLLTRMQIRRFCQTTAHGGTTTTTTMKKLRPTKEQRVEEEWQTIHQLLNDGDYMVNSLNTMGAFRTVFGRSKDSLNPPNGFGPILNCPFSKDIISTIQNCFSKNGKSLKKVTDSRLRGPYFGTAVRVEPWRTVEIDELTLQHIRSISSESQGFNRSPEMRTAHIVELGPGLDFRLERLAMKSKSKPKSQESTINDDNYSPYYHDSNPSAKNPSQVSSLSEDDSSKMELIQELKERNVRVISHELDVVEVMSLRKPFLKLVRLLSNLDDEFNKDDSIVIQHRMISKSTFHTGLITAIKESISDDPNKSDFSDVLFVSEAMFMHLNDLERLDLMSLLSESFPKAKMICDEKMPAVESLPSLKVEKSWNCYDDNPRVKEQLPLWFKFFFGIRFRNSYQMRIFEFLGK